MEEITWWPDYGHDTSCHILRTDFKETGTNQPWKWRLTVLKTIKMMLVRPPRWLPGLTMLCLYVAPPSVCKSSPHVIAELRTQPAFGETSTLPLPAPFSTNVVFLLAFEQQAAGPHSWLHLQESSDSSNPHQLLTLTAVGQSIRGKKISNRGCIF